MTTHPYNVAIVGAGIGREHLQAYLQLPNRFQVCTLCDLNESRAKEVLLSSPDTTYTNAIDSVLNDPAIDLIDICLPPHLHFQMCQRALLAGKSVVCEKPLVSSVKQADQLIALSKATGSSLFPVFQYRYGLASLQLQALIESGLTGKAFVATLETHWNRDKAYYAPTWRGTWAGEQGGAVLTHAIHIHDWLSFVLGPVKSVYAQLATRVNDIEVEDCAALSMTMHCGALVTSSITLGAHDDTSRLRFCFEGLTATSHTNPYAPADGQWSFNARQPIDQTAIDDVLSTLTKPLSGYVGYFDAVANELDRKRLNTSNHSMEKIDRPNHVTMEDGRRSLEFVSAVYASARSNRPIELPLSDNHKSYTGWGPD